MPSKSTLLVILFLSATAVFLGWNYYYHPFAGEPLEPVTQVSPSPSLEPAVSLTADWSVDQKVAQLVAFPAEIDSAGLDASVSASLPEIKPGFVTLFGTQISTVAAQRAISSIKEPHTSTQVPIAIMVDHEGGATQRLNGQGFTRLPSWRSFCTQSASISAQLLTQSAKEISQVGVNIVLAPVIDVASSNLALGSRICSHDPEVVATHAEIYLTAMNQVNILPVLKHFPGIGQTTRDLHRNFDQVTVDLDEAGLYPKLLDARPQTGVMVSHVGVENQYANLPCSLSADCVGELLTNYPRTLIFSDALEMVAAGYDSASDEPKPLAQRSIEAILAGNDVLIFGPAVTAEEMTLILRTMEQRYTADPVFAKAVDQRLEKVVLWKQTNL